MYAVIATGGKQYRVSEGTVVRVEKLDADAGATVEFNQVLLIGEGADVSVGAPYVTGARVTLEDLGSKNGTFLGKTRITGATEVRGGDEILIGTTKLRLVKVDALATTATAS